MKTARVIFSVALFGCLHVTKAMEEREKSERLPSGASREVSATLWANSELAAFIKKNNKFVMPGAPETCSDEETLAGACRALFSSIEQKSSLAFDLLVLCTFFCPTKIPAAWLENFVYNTTSDREMPVSLSESITLLQRVGLLSDRQGETYRLVDLCQQAVREYAPDARIAFCTQALSVLIHEGKKFEDNEERSVDGMKLWLLHAEFFWNQAGSLIQSSQIAMNTIHWAELKIIFGDVYLKLHDGYDKALEYYTQSLRLLNESEETQEIINKAKALTYERIGNTLYAQLRWSDALEYYQKSLNLRGECYAQDMSLLVRMGDTARELGDIRGALDYYERVGRIRRNSQKTGHFDVMSFLVKMTSLLRELNLPEDPQFSREIVRLSYRKSLHH